MQKISIITPTYNEEDNVLKLIEEVKRVFSKIPEYSYEHIFIDNSSLDRTVEILREEAKTDSRIKIIVNSRNFGHIRSPYYGLLQCTGDAAILLVADLQDPPDLIIDLVKKWEEGNDLVMAVKSESYESKYMFFLRKIYYSLSSKLAEIKLQKNFYGFGIYDKKLLEILKTVKDPYPYLRGLVLELGFKVDKIYYKQPVRYKGITKNNFFTLYDMAMLGICSHSRVPLRVATILGFALSALSVVVAFGYFIAKLIFWNSFSLGMAPLIISLFLFSSVQLFFIGIVGEYIGHLVIKSSPLPLVIEKERVNFD